MYTPTIHYCIDGKRLHTMYAIIKDLDFRFVSEIRFELNLFTGNKYLIPQGEQCL